MIGLITENFETVVFLHEYTFLFFVFFSTVRSEGNFDCENYAVLVLGSSLSRLANTYSLQEHPAHLPYNPPPPSEQFIGELPQGWWPGAYSRGGGVWIGSSHV